MENSKSRVFEIFHEEHDLILRMVRLVDKALEDVREQAQMDMAFFHDAVEFFRVFTNKAHHQKEEKLIFDRLQSKPLTPQHRRLVRDLLSEHEERERIVKEAGAAATKNVVASGESDFVGAMMFHLTALTTLYPGHIEKEDHLLLPILETYFSDAEWKEIIESFHAASGAGEPNRYFSMISRWERAFKIDGERKKGVNATHR